MNEQELQSFLEENKKLIYSGNVKTILKKVFERTKEIDPKILYDFIGEVLIEKPKLQEGKKQYKFLKGYKDFMSSITMTTRKIVYRIPPRQLLKLEKYFLEKYCLFDDEEILCSFYGMVIRSINFFDRVFITNYRIIIIEVYRPKESGAIPFMPWAGLTFNIVRSITNRMLNPKKTSITESAEPIDKVIFGVNFPIFNPTAITIPIMKKGVKFLAIVLRQFLPYWRKGMDEEIVYSVKFTSQTQPDPFDLSIYVNHKKPIFEAEKEYEDGQIMLHKIAEILQNIQEQQIAEST